MNYTIMHGISTKNGNHLLTLEKSGNLYVVALTDKSEWRTVRKFATESYNTAEIRFYMWAEECGINLIKEVDTTDVCDFINSHNED